MLEEILDILFESAVNCYQGFIMTYFLITCLGHKIQYGRKMVYITGTIVLSMYLEVQMFLTDFEGVGVLLLMLMSTIFSLLFLNENFIRKILYNVMLILLLTFSAILAGSLIGLFNDIGYIELVSVQSFAKYISMILNQIILFAAVKLVISLIRHNSMGLGVGYTLTAFLMSVTGVVTIVLLQRILNNKSGEYALFYTFAVASGIVAMVVISLVLYAIGEKQHWQRLQNEIEVNAYRSQKQDVEEINRNYKRIGKVTHEVNKVTLTVLNLLQEEKYKEAEQFLKQFHTEEKVLLDNVFYTENIILNSLINRKAEECQKNKIDMKCIVNGKIDGIQDIDLHCIISNLLDNAIEAVQKLDDKKIELSVFGNEYSVYIEASNIVQSDIITKNPLFKTTKADKFRHGHGISNIKEKVEKYQGEIEYKQNIDNYLTCRIMLIKQFTTEKGNSRQIG